MAKIRATGWGAGARKSKLTPDRVHVFKGVERPELNQLIRRKVYYMVPVAESLRSYRTCRLAMSAD